MKNGWYCFDATKKIFDCQKVLYPMSKFENRRTINAFDDNKSAKATMRYCVTHTWKPKII